MRSAKGLFLVLEGPDKSGKSTQARLLVDRLRGMGLAVEHTREPGGTSIAEAVRRVVLAPEHRVDAVAELLLYEAARAQHTAEKLRPWLAEGRVVVCERYTLSTVVYQGYGRGLDLKLVNTANELATGGLKADLTFVFDIPDEEFGARDAGRVHDRLESEPKAFRARVRAGYKKVSAPGLVRLDGRKAVDEIQAELLKRIMPKLKTRVKSRS